MLTGDHPAQRSARQRATGLLRQVGLQALKLIPDLAHLGSQWPSHVPSLTPEKHLPASNASCACLLELAGKSVWLVSRQFPWEHPPDATGACPGGAAELVRINTREPLGRWGSGKEHKLRSDGPGRSPKEQIPAKGLLLHPNGPTPGQHCRVDCLQGQTESQHIAQQQRAPPACDGASISCNGHLPEKNSLASPTLGLHSSPRGCRFVHVLHAACLRHAGPCARTLRSIAIILSKKRINSNHHHHHQMQAAR